jgi:hypothetical protein
VIFGLIRLARNEIYRSHPRDKRVSSFLHCLMGGSYKRNFNENLGIGYDSFSPTPMILMLSVHPLQRRMRSSLIHRFLHEPSHLADCTL